MNLAVFRARRFVRFEAQPGYLEPGLVRVPVKVPDQPPHVPERHYLWSKAVLDADQNGATIVYSVHDRPQDDPGAEAPPPKPVIVEPPPGPVPPPVDDPALGRRLDDLNAAIADMGALVLRQQQELAELRSAAAKDLGTIRDVVAILLKVVATVDVASEFVKLAVQRDGVTETIGVLTKVQSVKAKLAPEEIALIGGLFPEEARAIRAKIQRDAA